MKVFTVTGLSGSGKTTVIESIVKELKQRGYSIGTVKEIHYDAFKLDVPGKNTYRHREAGAATVTARAHQETDIMYNRHIPIYEVLKHYKEDYVVMEGVRDAVVPEIVVCQENEEPQLTQLTFMVSGKFANKHSGFYKGVPIFNALYDISELVDLIIDKVPNLFYDMDPKCCSACGTDCRGFLAAVLKGERKRSECLLNGNITLKIAGDEVPMVPFVQNILKNAVKGVVSELKGYNPDADIEIIVKGDGK